MEAAAKMDVPIFVHPWATVGVERMPRHQLYVFDWNAIRDCACCSKLNLQWDFGEISEF